MEFFLENIARSLYSEFGNQLNEHCIVFPNRRAGLYFLKYLSTRIDKPVWAPSVMTINELFRSYSPAHIAGNEILLFELYKVYRDIKKSNETFDDFYYWGDMLLNDFDDVDKYLVSASNLFSNISDTKKIDQQFGGLTDAQIEIIKRFWLNFNPEKQTAEKAGFISIWAILNDLYTEFRKRLNTKGLAYEGMIFREIAEIDEEHLSVSTKWKHVHFVGFNALNDCEKRLMTQLKNLGIARFYWDYDISYIREGSPNSAGFFMRDNLKSFGNNMSSDWDYNTMVRAGSDRVKRQVIDTSSDVAQVKLISRLLDDLPDLNESNAHHTAVVLADENLLISVLSSLPENIPEINVTMGYPLKQTLLYTLVRKIMELQRKAVVVNNDITFGYKEVLGIMNHPLIASVLSDSDKKIYGEITSSNILRIPEKRFRESEKLSGIFVRKENPVALSQYLREILSIFTVGNELSADVSSEGQNEKNIRNEFIYRTVLSLNKLETIINSPDITFSNDTYFRILDRMLRSQSVPFSGEPLTGIQIMGILETRTLDFKNLIILGVNEGILPAISSGSSFIPFSLREAFGLPSINHQESIYAYHFYRLQQRAENVTFVYNSNSEGLKSGEMSRFLIQMSYDENTKPVFTDLNFEIKTQAIVSESISRTSEHNERLRSVYIEKKSVLSPSAINTWLNCRMKFFYRYVNGLKEPDKITGEIDPAVLGNILHEMMKNIYLPYKAKIVDREVIESLLNNRELQIAITNEAIKEKYSISTENILSGNELIVREVLLVYLNRILETDRSIAPFTILETETQHTFKLMIGSNESAFEIISGGNIDRIDKTGGVTRIVDYKTGSVADIVESIEELLLDDRKKDSDGWLQTLIYCEAYSAVNTSEVVRPSIYKIKKLASGKISDNMRIKTGERSDISIEDYNTVRDKFMEEFKITLSKIFDINEPFSMTSDKRGKCQYCAYKSLCSR
jgi:hypothetical protein